MPAEIRHVYRVETAEARRRIREFRNDAAGALKDFDTGSKAASDGLARAAATARSSGATIAASLSKAGGVGAEAFKRQSAAIMGAMAVLKEGGQKGSATYKALLMQADQLGRRAAASGHAMDAAFKATAAAGARAKAALDAENEAAKRAKVSIDALGKAQAAAFAENARREQAMGRMHAAALAENARRDAAPDRRRLFIAELGQSISASGIPGASALGGIAAAAGPIAAVVATLTALAGGLALVTSRAITFESAFAGVRKTVEASEPEYAAIRQQILALSTEIPQSAGELAKIAATAGQFGIAKGDLVEFTKTVANLGVAVDGISAEEAAGKLAQIGVVTHASTPEIERMASVLVELGNKGNSTEAQILDLAKRISAAGNDAGLSKAAIFGFAGAIANAGIEAEAGGTAFSKSIRAMGIAVAKGGSQLDGFAKIAHTSAKDFASAFGRDPQQAMLQFLEGLARVKAEGGNVGIALEGIGIKGARQIDTLSRLSQNTGQVAEQLRLANAEFINNTALAREAGERYGTTASQITLLKNSFDRIAIALGTEVLPITKELLLSLRDLVAGDFPAQFAHFAVEGVKLGAAILNIVTYLNPFTAGIRLATDAFSLLSSAMGFTFGEALSAALDTASNLMERLRLRFEQVFLNIELFAVEAGVAIAEGIVGPLAKRIAELAPLLSKLGAVPGLPGGAALGAAGEAATSINNNLAGALGKADEKAKALTERIAGLDGRLKKLADTSVKFDRGQADLLSVQLDKANKRDAAYRASLGLPTIKQAFGAAKGPGVDDEPGSGGGGALRESFLKRDAKLMKDLALDTMEAERSWSHFADLSSGKQKRLSKEIIDLKDRYAEMGETAPEAFQKIAAAAESALAGMDLQKKLDKAWPDFNKELRKRQEDSGKDFDRMMSDRAKEIIQHHKDVWKNLGLTDTEEIKKQGAELAESLALVPAQGARAEEAMRNLAPQIAAYIEEARKAGVKVPPALEAAFNADKAREFGATIGGVIQGLATGATSLKSILGGLGSDALGGLLSGKAGVSKGGLLGGLLGEGGPLGGLFKGGGLGKLFGGSGLASNLGSGIAGLFGKHAVATAAGPALQASGLLSGLFTAGIGTAISLGAPAILGGLKKLFSGTPEWKKVAKAAGTAYGTDISDEMAHAIRQRQKDLGVSRGLGVALALPEVAEQATITGANLGKFTAQFDVLLKAAAAGGKGAKEALEAAGQGFDVLVHKAQEAGATGTAAFGQLIAGAKAAGLEQFKVFAGQSTAAAGGFLGTILENARIGKKGEGLASLGGLSSGLLGALKGLPGAGATIDALGPSLDKIAEKAKKAGAALPAGIAGLIGERDFRKKNEDLFATNDALAGFTKSLGEAGFIGADTFTAIEDQVKKLNADFIGAGRSQQDALATIAPTLQEIVNEHQRNGTAIDAETQALVDQAAGMGLVKQEGTGLIVTLQEGFNAIITQLGGDPIFGKLKVQAESAAAQIGQSTANIANQVSAGTEAAANAALSAINRLNGAGVDFIDIKYNKMQPEPETHALGGPVVGRGVAGDGEYVVSRKGRRATGDALLDAANAGTLRGGGGGIVIAPVINLSGSATQADADLIVNTMIQAVHDGRFTVPENRVTPRRSR